MCQGLVVREHVASDRMTGHWREGSIVGAEAGKGMQVPCHAGHGIRVRLQNLSWESGEFFRKLSIGSQGVLVIT